MFQLKVHRACEKKKSFVGIEARECSYTSVHCSPACVTCLSVYNVICVSVCAPIFGSYKLISVGLAPYGMDNCAPIATVAKKDIKAAATSTLLESLDFV